jgi:hypothetical protein
MPFLRTSIRGMRFRPRFPRIGTHRSIFGFNIGSSIATRDIARSAGKQVDLEGMLGGLLDGEAPALGEQPEAEDRPAPPPPPPIRRRGPATLLERRDRLDYALDRLVVKGAHVEYQANTLALIKPMHPLLRFLRFLLMLPLIPLRLVLRAVAWALRPNGHGKLNRTVVFVDRRGNVVVYKM